MWFLLLLKGVGVGLVIALPAGPVGVLCVRRTLLNGRLAGFISGVGAASADTVFGIIAASGLTVVSDMLLSYQDWLRVGGAAFLFYLGARALWSQPPEREDDEKDPETLVADFVSTFVLTITNPVTILAFLAIFAGVGFAGAEATMVHAIFLVLGVFLGSLLWWGGISIGASLLSLKRRHLVWINRGSGGLLVFSGVALLGSLLVEHWP